MTLNEDGVVKMEAAMAESADAESPDEMSDDEAADYVRSGYVSEEPEEETLIVGDEAPLDMKLVQQIPCVYTDIIAEFADVEIFLISLDSLLVELTAHRYHNWILGGQTVVLASQIERFLKSLEELNAKFKLIWFRDLRPLYQKDTVLSFLHSFMLAYLKQSKWAEQIEEFASPADPSWSEFLHRLTPSFLLMSLENPRSDVFTQDVDLQSKLPSVAIHLIVNTIPVVFFSAFTINLTSVMSYRLSTKPMNVPLLEQKLKALWDSPVEPVCRTTDVSACQDVADFLAEVIAEECKKGGKDKDFEELASAALLSALVGIKCGVQRNYAAFDDVTKAPGVNVLRARRRLLDALTKKLDTVDLSTVKFPLADIWDGRLIYGVFQKVNKQVPILPFRMQERFARCHAKADLDVSLATDSNERLLDPPTPEEPPKKRIDWADIYRLKSNVVDELFPELKAIIQSHPESNNEVTHYEEAFRSTKKWKFNVIDEKVMQPEEKITDPKMLKKQNYYRQVLSRWYQGFADSLEGRGNDLLVDFSRTPRLTAIAEPENAATENEAAAKGKKPEKPKKAPKPGSKAASSSKKDQILEANKQNLIKKQVESDKQKIAFATQVKGNSITALEEVLRKLELNESKALCVFELVLRYADIFTTKAQVLEDVEAKRSLAIDLVGKLKECFTKHWKHFDDRQKDKIKEFWVSLGFENDPKRRGNKQLNLGMNFVYYQLYHGGRLIDVLSDPKKDDRVTGFNPDAWQRKMLDAVDNYNSALIIAPTSAGKTFVSYYCIEKILRQSNDDVVVYVSPSKALTNQACTVCGSVYARFRNKPMVGGKTLFGTLTAEFSEAANNCQVLVTIPECLEQLLLSPDPQVQQLVSRIKYVILDEVHCINATGQGHMWEHIFLLIRCPFLALSATVSNNDVFHSWLQGAENRKALEGTKARDVALIVYQERWSELELSLQRLRECPKDLSYRADTATFGKSINLQASKLASAEEADTQAPLEVSRTQTLQPEEDDALAGSSVQNFMPYSVYKLEKLRMFGIPDDQQLTARQIMEFYDVVAAVDEKTKAEFEPCKYFGYEPGSDKLVWLTRKDIRELETALKTRFLDWLKNDPQKVNEVFARLEKQVKEEFDKRSKPFHMVSTALHNIVPLVDDLKKSEMLPALCFNEDRDVCQALAIRVFNELQAREERFQASAEFQRKFNFKAENKLAKLAKRKRDEDEKAKKSKKKGDKDDEREVELPTEEVDQFAIQRMKLKEALAKFKLGKGEDEMLEKNVQRLKSRARYRDETKVLLKLFERGIGFHHEGLNAVERGTVEILFRAGYLGIVFSTSTLALGMNMPCKTVVFGIDSPKLTPLQFRQMSGRAGRRGFDPAGTVIFMTLPTSKIRRLLTASLQTLRGNAPYTTSFFLRLFNFVVGWQNTAVPVIKDLSIKDKPLKKKAPLDTNDLLSPEIRLRAVMTLLENSFVLYTSGKDKQEAVKRRLHYLSLFNIQLLRKLDLLSESCELTGFAIVAVHLSNFEPGNLLFVELLQKGAFHRLLKKYDETQKAELKPILINILAHIFTNKPLPIYGSYEATDEVKQPVLKPMPEDFENIRSEYNKTVDDLLMAFLELSTEDNKDAKLAKLLDPVCEITGNTSDLSVYDSDVVSPMKDGLILDHALIPSLATKQIDHRGNKIYRNSYAYDFYLSGSRKTLTGFNKLAINEIWYLINDFDKALIAIKESLAAVGKNTDPVVMIFAELSEEFHKKFGSAFAMKVT